MAAVVGAPLAMLLIGGGAGWLLRDTDDGTGPATVATVVGATLPADLNQVAPEQRLIDTPNSAVIDPASIIGLHVGDGVEVPAAAALHVPLTVADNAAAVDATTHLAVDPPTPLTRPQVASTPIVALPPLAAPEGTVPLQEQGADTTTTANDPLFADPCATAEASCAGLPGVVKDGVVNGGVAQGGAGDQLAPLRISMPSDGAEGFAALCDSVEEGEVSDPALSPATRPTVAVLVNQPSTLALTGTWGDGVALAKTTMVTSAAHDAEWQRSWDQDRVQRNIIACVTLPLDDVRAHAGEGVAELRANILAISATGRADISGPVTLDIPTDGNDPLFAERLTIANRGEQRRADGVLYPTVHVHYAILTDAVAPDDSGLDAANVHVYAQHAFVEGADCNGWSANQQGRDRTKSAMLNVTVEERTVAGRQHTVSVVDGDVYLDPTMPAGWEGQLCVQLTATDRPAGPSTGRAKPVVLALLGATLRGPRTSEYAFSVLVDATTAPAAGELTATWVTPDGTTVCPGAPVGGDGQPGGGTCTTSARFAADGVWVAIKRGDSPLVSARVAVNTSYCNPDDPFGAASDGCNHGFTQPLEIPVDGDTLRVVLQVDRTAVAGGLWQDPSQAWKVGPVTSFA